LAATILSADWCLSEPQGATLLADHGVLVEGDLVRAIGPTEALKAAHPAAAAIDLGAGLLMPGLVNAHQHGRGLSQIQLGHLDTYLELWIAGRRRRGLLDPYAITRLAALRMLQNGVTACVHANYSYGTGDYEAEARAQIRAYVESGLRVTFCVGAQDRGLVVYGPCETCFQQGLSAEVRAALDRSGKPAYAADIPATIALMDRLLADFGDHPRVTLAWGPAGPQWVSEPLLTAIVAHAKTNRLGLHMHVLESPAQAEACRQIFPQGALRWLDGLGALGPPTTLAHAIWVDDDDIAILAKTGTNVVRAPGCNLRMRNGIQPTNRLVAAGVKVALGTDNATLQDDEDLLSELRLMDVLARGTDWNGFPPLSMGELLASVTTHGARAAFLSEPVGRIAVGAHADLIAIDLRRATEPVLHPDMKLLHAVLARTRGDDLGFVMVGGVTHYHDGHFTQANENEIVAAAVETATDASYPRRAPLDPAQIEELISAMAAHYRRQASS
jgi:5-methylthioadenosine/S-adenosylhomocysteine deaminase